jgi:hypothetical protein
MSAEIHDVISPPAIAKLLGLAGSNGQINPKWMQVYTFSTPELVLNGGGELMISFSPVFAHTPTVIAVTKHRHINVATEAINNGAVIIGYRNVNNFSMNAISGHTVVAFDREYVFGGGQE